MVFFFMFSFSGYNNCCILQQIQKLTHFMKKNYLTLLMATGLVMSINAQNVKDASLQITKIVHPTLLQLNTPIDINVQFVSNSDVINAGGFLKANFITPKFISNNTSNAAYTAIVNFSYENPYLEFDKKALNRIVIKSNIHAELILIQNGKGVFSTEKLQLLDPGTNETFARSELSAYSSQINKLIPDAEASKYMDSPKAAKPSVIRDVEQEQVSRLVSLAYKAINDKMADAEERTNFDFSYLKEDKEFDTKDINAIFNLVKDNSNCLNKSSFTESLKLYQQQFEKYASNNDKKINKLKIAILENMCAVAYLIDDYSYSDFIETNLKALDPKSRRLSFYERSRKKYEERLATVKVGRALDYQPFPQELLSISKNGDVISKAEEGALTIKKMRSYDNNIYILPVFKLNNFNSELKAVGEKGILPQYQNDLMSNILWYLMRYSDNVQNLKSSEKKELQPLEVFAKKFKDDVEKSKITQGVGDKDAVRQKLREYASQNYTLEDFTKFIPLVTSAVDHSVANISGKREFTAEVFANAIKLDAIITMRNLLANDSLDETDFVASEKSIEGDLDTLVTKYSRIVSKDEVYFEFKNSIKVFEAIKNKRSLSDEERENYEVLLQNVVHKVVYR